MMLILISNNMTMLFRIGTDSSFEQDKAVLIAKSKYFSDLLSEFSGDTITLEFPDINPKIFGRFLKWLRGKKKVSTQVSKAFDLFRLLDRFLVDDFDLLTEVQKISAADANLMTMIHELRHFYQQNFPTEVIDELARFYRDREDISSLSESLVDSIMSSSHRRKYPTELKELLYYLEDLAKSEAKLGVMHHYFVVACDLKFSGYGIADVALQVQDWSQRNAKRYEKHDKHKCDEVVPFYLDRACSVTPELVNTIPSLMEDLMWIEDSNIIYDKREQPGIMEYEDLYADSLLTATDTVYTIERSILPDKDVIFFYGIFIGLAKKNTSPVLITHLIADVTITWHKRHKLSDIQYDEEVSYVAPSILQDSALSLQRLQIKHNKTISELFALAPHYDRVITVILSRYDIRQID